VTAHVGHRLQATVVLTCPGLDLSGLRALRSTEAVSAGTDLAPELASLRSRIDGPFRARWEAALRRGRKVERTLRSVGRWEEETTIREQLRNRLPRPQDADFPAEDPPELHEGIDRLPLVHGRTSNPLALASGPDGWSIREVYPTGGSESRGTFVPIDRPPELTPSGLGLLHGYLAYMLERDSFLASVQLRSAEAAEGTVGDWAEIELAALGAVVLARGTLLAHSRGESPTELSDREVADGIRATDMDWLDRPTWGDRI
jgi:hypothetical protein